MLLRILLAIKFYDLPYPLRIQLLWNPHFLQIQFCYLLRLPVILSVDNLSQSANFVKVALYAEHCTVINNAVVNTTSNIPNDVLVKTRHTGFTFPK